MHLHKGSCSGLLSKKGGCFHAWQPHEVTLVWGPIGVGFAWRASCARVLLPIFVAIVLPCAGQLLLHQVWLLQVCNSQGNCRFCPADRACHGNAVAKSCYFRDRPCQGREACTCPSCCKLRALR